MLGDVVEQLVTEPGPFIEAGGSASARALELVEFGPGVAQVLQRGVESLLEAVDEDGGLEAGWWPVCAGAGGEAEEGSRLTITRGDQKILEKLVPKNSVEVTRPPETRPG